MTNVEWLQAEVERLTAELAGEEAVIDHWLKVAGKYKTYWEAAEAREKKLRAITGLMAPHPRVWDDAWSNCCAEWDLRASGIV